jgi:hypothetical protein
MRMRMRNTLLLVRTFKTGNGTTLETIARIGWREMVRDFLEELPAFVAIMLFISMLAVWCAIGGGVL